MGRGIRGFERILVFGRVKGDGLGRAVYEGLEEEDEAGVGLGELDEFGGWIGKGVAGEGGGGEGAKGMGRIAVEVSAVGDHCGQRRGQWREGGERRGTYRAGRDRGR